MSSAKATMIEQINSMPDDMNTMEIVERLLILNRLEHSKQRCEAQGTMSDAEMMQHFRDRKI